MRGRHNRFSGFRVPSLQGPDVVEGGGGGGGTAPTAPSDVTLAIPASKMISYGGTGHALMTNAWYQTWKGWGFGGYCGRYEGQNPQGTAQLFKGSSAAGDATPGPYDWQRAYQGLPVTAINGGGTGLGVFKARQADPTISAGIVTGFFPLGLWDDTPSGRAAQITKLQGVAAFIEFMGGDLLFLDLETELFWAASAGHTQDQTNTQIEQYGYELGTALWGTQTFPSLDLILYYWHGFGSWQNMAQQAGGPAPPYSPMPAAHEGARQYFVYGLMRAHAATNATGHIRFMDAWFYRGVQLSGASMATALKWNTQGRIAAVSRGVSYATWSQCALLFDVSPFSWAGTDTTPYYMNSQEEEPGYNISPGNRGDFSTNIEWYRKYGMGGMRGEFILANAAAGGFGTPGRGATEGGEHIWAGGNNYLTPTGRIAGMQAAASTSGSYSTTAPTLSASASGSGSTRTITGTAAHEYGIRTVKAYIYPSGTQVHGQMTFNLGGGTPFAGIANCFMEYTIPLTGVATGNYAIVTAYSTLNQQKSTVVGPL